jgi:hypothetical protein
MHYELKLQDKVKLIMAVIVKFLNSINWHDHYLVQMSTAQVLCLAIVSGMDYDNNYERTIVEFEKAKVFNYVLSKSQFGRRLVPVTDQMHLIVEQIATFAEEVWIDRFPCKQIEKNIYKIDTKPVPICKNIRIPNCHLVQNHKSKQKIKSKTTGKMRRVVDEDYRGYCASRKEHYYGFKLNVITNCFNLPREYSVHCARTGDLDCMKSLNLNLPSNSELLGDKAYNDNELETYLITSKEYNFKLIPIRKRNSKQMYNSDYYGELTNRILRRPVETFFSQIEKLTKNIHATTINGFVIKIHLSVLAYSFTQLIKLGLLTT